MTELPTLQLKTNCSDLKFYLKQISVLSSKAGKRMNYFNNLNFTLTPLIYQTRFPVILKITSNKTSSDIMKNYSGGFVIFLKICNESISLWEKLDITKWHTATEQIQWISFLSSNGFESINSWKTFLKICSAWFTNKIVEVHHMKCFELPLALLRT